MVARRDGQHAQDVLAERNEMGKGKEFTRLAEVG